MIFYPETKVFMAAVIFSSFNIELKHGKNMAATLLHQMHTQKNIKGGFDLQSSITS